MKWLLEFTMNHFLLQVFVLWNRDKFKGLVSDVGHVQQGKKRNQCTRTNVNSEPVSNGMYDSSSTEKNAWGI